MPSLVWRLLALFVAGGLGTWARYGLSLWIRSGRDSLFPWDTLVVNALGCFLFGLIAGLIPVVWSASDEWRLVIFTGFLGGFTTFSAYAFQTVDLAGNRRFDLAVANVLAQNGVGMACLVIGIWLAQWIAGPASGS
jgi:fluoride exporter